MTYEYMFCEGPCIGKVVERSQRITEPALTDIDGYRVKRLIATAAPVQFVSGPSGGWANTGYAKPANHRWGEAMLGRPLTRPGGR